MHCSPPVHREHGVANRNIAIAGGVVDLPPVLDLAAAGSFEHFGDLGTAFDRDGLNPWRPFPADEIGIVVWIDGAVDNRPVAIDHKRDVARDHCQLHRRFWIERFEQFGSPAKRVFA